jgi:hypothetical protein
MRTVVESIPASEGAPDPFATTRDDRLLAFSLRHSAEVSPAACAVTENGNSGTAS